MCGSASLEAALASTSSGSESGGTFWLREIFLLYTFPLNPLQNENIHYYNVKKTEPKSCYLSSLAFLLRFLSVIFLGREKRAWGLKKALR